MKGPTAHESKPRPDGPQRRLLMIRSACRDATETRAEAIDDELTVPPALAGFLLACELVGHIATEPSKSEADQAQRALHECLIWLEGSILGNAELTHRGHDSRELERIHVEGMLPEPFKAWCLASLDTLARWGAAEHTETDEADELLRAGLRIGLHLERGDDEPDPETLATLARLTDPTTPADGPLGAGRPGVHRAAKPEPEPEPEPNPWQCPLCQGTDLEFQHSAWIPANVNPEKLTAGQWLEGMDTDARPEHYERDTFCNTCQTHTIPQRRPEA